MSGSPRRGDRGSGGERTPTSVIAAAAEGTTGEGPGALR